jgi:hypothetical protein
MFYCAEKELALCHETRIRLYIQYAKKYVTNQKILQRTPFRLTAEGNVRIL